MSDFGSGTTTKPRGKKKTLHGHMQAAANAYPYRFQPGVASAQWKGADGKLTAAAKKRQAMRQSVAVRMGWVKPGQDFSIQELRKGHRAEILTKLGLLPGAKTHPGAYDPKFVLKNAQGKGVGPIGTDINVKTTTGKSPHLHVGGYLPPPGHQGVSNLPSNFQGFPVPPAGPGQNQGQVSGSGQAAPRPHHAPAAGGHPGGSHDFHSAARATVPRAGRVPLAKQGQGEGERARRNLLRYLARAR